MLPLVHGISEGCAWSVGEAAVLHASSPSGCAPATWRKKRVLAVFFLCTQARPEVEVEASDKIEEFKRRLRERAERGELPPVDRMQALTKGILQEDHTFSDNGLGEGTTFVVNGGLRGG